MGVPEPSSAHGLWPKVRTFSGWPQTAEESMFALADGWTTAGTHFAEPSNFSTAPGQAAWSDGAGDAFAGSTVRTVNRAVDSAGDIALLARAAGDFGTEVRNLKLGLNDLINVNLEAYAAIQGLPPGVREIFDAVFVAQVATFATTMITATAARAATLGAVPVSAVTAPGTPAAGVPADPLAGLPPIPPPGSSPAEVAAWWRNLPSDELRAQIVLHHAELIGNLDGIPAAVRDQANQSLLGRRRSELEAERAGLQARLDGLQGAAARQPGIRRKLEEQIAAVNGKLDGLQAVQNALAPSPGLPPGLLLRLDTGGEGRFIVSRGDPDKAANVATFVPGAESNLSSAGRALQRADGLYTAAVRAGSPSTAVITWMNYDSPDSAATAPFNSSSADEAAPRLNTFQQGLLLTHDSSTSHNTLVGHSYGAKVAAQAASQPGQSSVDDVIGAGAFDLGGGPASDVHVDPGHVWVIEHQKDAAADINVHNDPSSPDFGARVYGAEPGPYRDKWAGLARLATDQPAHGNYFDNDPDHAAGLARMGDIIAGHQPR